MMRDSQWTVLHRITLHTDSVWDLAYKEGRLVTGGLDGTLAAFRLEDSGRDLEVTCIMQVYKALVFAVLHESQLNFFSQAANDLVSAVDFDAHLLVAGYEDSHIGLWTLDDRPGAQPLPIGKMEGHNGGVTGLSINTPMGLLASCSYDFTVRIWGLNSLSCLRTFDDPQNFVRCVDFGGGSGGVIVAGDFGGIVHAWDVTAAHEGGTDPTISVGNHRIFKGHKGHVVCVQVSDHKTYCVCV